MQKKRVGVITFHNYDNYGAILQSYALQKKLQEIGTQPAISATFPAVSNATDSADTCATASLSLRVKCSR